MRENVLSLEPKETIIIFAVIDVDEVRQRVRGRSLEVLSAVRPWC